MTKSVIWQLVERAIKTAAQTLAALIAATSFDWVSADWQAIAGTVATATVLSVLTSIGSLKIGPADTPSVVPVDAPAHLVDIAPAD